MSTRERYRVCSRLWGLEEVYWVQYYGRHWKLTKTGMFRKEWKSFTGWYRIGPEFSFAFEAREFITKDMAAKRSLKEDSGEGAS